MENNKNSVVCKRNIKTRLILGNRQEPVVGKFVYFLSKIFEVKALIRSYIYRVVGVNPI